MNSARAGRVVVVGSINMDIVAEVATLPRHGETISSRSLRQYPGGKGANQAVAAARAGAEAKLIGAVGDDSYADELLTFLQRHDVDVTDVDRFGGPSGSAIITVDGTGENVIVITTGANRFVTPSSLKLVDFYPSDVIVLQNEVPLEANREATARARAAGAKVVYNPAPWLPESIDIARSVDVLIVNEIEFIQYLRSDADDLTVDEIDRALREVSSPANIIVTMGDDGAIGRFGSEYVRREAIKVTSRDSTGAGDAFSGAFAAALATGSSCVEALEFANVAAGLSVERLGAGPSMPTRAEVEQRQADER